MPNGGCGPCCKISSAKGDASKKSQRLKMRPHMERFRYETTAPNRFKTGMVPINALEQKEKFLKFGKTPEFELKASPEEVKRLVSHQIGNIKFNLFHEARRILDLVVKKYKKLDRFVESNYGPPLTVDEAAEKVHDYMLDHKLENTLEVIWCSELACSAQMSSTGPDPKAGKPELRRYTLLIKSSSENIFLKDKGIICLMDHEIGTHYFRSFNDGYQPWYSCRDKYKLLPSKSFETMKTEEGLACIHTLFNSNHKMLCMPALLYYACCMAEYLSFKQLFDHLSKYVQNPEQRWKHCMRVKRGLKNVNDTGGYGKDQRYFEGAVEILRNLDTIDFMVLMSGKITWDEVERVKRVARTGVIRLPHFMRDMDAYKLQLERIAKLNGLIKPAIKPKIQFGKGPNEKGEKVERMTREELLAHLHKLELCRELPRGISCSRHNTLDTTCSGDCGCLLFTKPRRRISLAGTGAGISPSAMSATNSNRRNSRAYRDRGKNEVPVLIELETMLPVISS